MCSQANCHQHELIVPCTTFLSGVFPPLLQAGQRAQLASSIYLFFKSLTHESVGWLGGKTQPAIKEIADERHGVDTVPTHRSRLLQIPCFRASTGQLELRFLALRSRSYRQAHLKSSTVVS